jgi:hypothetical protein
LETQADFNLTEEDMVTDNLKKLAANVERLKKWF